MKLQRWIYIDKNNCTIKPITLLFHKQYTFLSLDFLFYLDPLYYFSSYTITPITFFFSFFFIIFYIFLKYFLLLSKQTTWCTFFHNFYVSALVLFRFHVPQLLVVPRHIFHCCVFYSHQHVLHTIMKTRIRRKYFTRTFRPVNNKIKK